MKTNNNNNIPASVKKLICRVTLAAIILIIIEIIMMIHVSSITKRMDAIDDRIIELQFSVSQLASDTRGIEKKIDIWDFDPNTITAEQIDTLIELLKEKEEAAASVSEPTPTTTYSSDPDTRFAEIKATYTSANGTVDVSNFVSIGTRRITGYDLCMSCCGKPQNDPDYGITASGRYVSNGRTCAVNGIPFGTILYIDGIGFRVVEDRGGMKNGGVDIYCDNHTQCYAITRNADVYIVWDPTTDM